MQLKQNYNIKPQIKILRLKTGAQNVLLLIQV